MAIADVVEPMVSAYHVVGRKAYRVDIELMMECQMKANERPNEHDLMNRVDCYVHGNDYEYHAMHRDPIQMLLMDPAKAEK
jgi:hypothetical protein